MAVLLAEAGVAAAAAVVHLEEDAAAEACSAEAAQAETGQAAASLAEAEGAALAAVSSAETGL